MESRVIWETALRNESHILVIIVCDVCQIGVTERSVKPWNRWGKMGEGNRTEGSRRQEVESGQSKKLTSSDSNQLNSLASSCVF